MTADTQHVSANYRHKNVPSILGWFVLKTTAASHAVAVTREETMAHAHESGRIDLGMGGLTAAVGDHIGHYYQSEAESQALVVGYLVAGLQSGDEKCVYLCDDAARDRISSALGDRGVDVAEALASGQLTLDRGRASAEELTDFLHQALADVPAQYRLLRMAGDMTWAFQQMADTETLMECETCFNILHAQAVFLCQFDLHRFIGSVIIDALKSHPLAIVGNTVHQNPYYIDPADFLQEIRSRPTTQLMAH